MGRQRKQSLARGGFTLVEVLVTLLLIGLLIGVVLPSVIGQTARGETNRIAEDLESIRSATKMFRVDVNRWPGALDQLVDAPASWSTTTDLFGNAISSGLQSKWNGPYLEVGALVGDQLETALDGTINTAFSTKSWGGNDFLLATVSGLVQGDAESVSELIDGDTNVTSTDDDAGRVRWDGTNLEFLAAPVNN